VEPEELFAGHPVALAILARVRSALENLGPVEIRASKSQVSFRRLRGFAYLWVPGQYLKRPGADVVLSFALGRRAESQRFKEIVHPSPKHWMHHLETHDVDDVDDDVVGWLREAADRAG
jgi:hypothetical protein